MTDLRDRFAERYLKHGGRFETNDHLYLGSLLHARGLADAATQFAGRTHRPRPRVYVDFYESDIVGMVSNEEASGDQAFIGISSSFVSTMWNMFREIVLRGGGEVLGEAGLRGAPVGDHFLITALTLADWLAAEGPRPGKETELWLALMLYRRALHFAVSHELTHTMQRHTLLDLSGDPFLERGMVSQAMEMHCDIGATRQTIGQVTATWLRPPAGLAQLTLATPRSTAFGIFFPLYLYFRQSERSLGPDLVDLDSRTHPPPAVRKFVLVSEMNNALKWSANSLPDSAQRDGAERLRVAMDAYWPSWFLQAERAFAALYGEQPDLTGTRKALSLEGVEHVKRIHETWAAVRPYLEPLTRDDLPATGLPPTPKTKRDRNQEKKAKRKKGRR